MKFLLPEGAGSQRAAVLLLFLLILPATRARAQMTAEIFGMVVDPSGGAVAGAQVRILAVSGTNQWLGTAFEFPRNSEVDAIVMARSGFPVAPQLSFSPSNNGDTRNSIRSSFNPSFTGPIAPGRRHRYVDPNSFTVLPIGTLGNAGRDNPIGPGLETFDLSVSKTAAVAENLKREFRRGTFQCFQPGKLQHSQSDRLYVAGGDPGNYGGHYCRCFHQRPASRVRTQAVVVGFNILELRSSPDDSRLPIPTTIKGESLC